LIGTCIMLSYFSWRFFRFGWFIFGLLGFILICWIIIISVNNFLFFYFIGLNRRNGFSFYCIFYMCYIWLLFFSLYYLFDDLFFNLCWTLGM